MAAATQRITTNSVADGGPNKSTTVTADVAEAIFEDGAIPANKLAALNAAGVGTLFVIHKSCVAATPGIDIFNSASPAPFAFRIVDVTCQCNGAVAGATATIHQGSVAAPGTAITDAMVCAVNKVVTRVGTIDDAEADIAAGGSLTVVKAAANNQPVLTIFCVKL